MEVQTVIGKIPGSEMGVTLPHEHILVDMRSFWSRPSREDELYFVDSKISMEMVGFLAHNMLACKDNLVLDLHRWRSTFCHADVVWKRRLETGVWPSRFIQVGLT